MSVFINAISFEDRCLAVPMQVPMATASDNQFYTLDFVGYEDVAPYVFNKSEMLKHLKEKDYKTELIPASVTAPLHAIDELKVRLDGQLDGRVVLDISSLPRTFIFTFAKFLAGLGALISIRYARPITYGSELSRGVRLLSAIPGFEGQVDPEGMSILVIILGLEGYKADYAVEIIGPSRIVALVGDPPFEDSLIERSRRNNQTLLRRSNLQERTMHTFDPFIGLEQLEGIYNEVSGPDTSLILCPLGTKVQSLASFAFAERHPEVGVVYISSVRYLPEEYSQGFLSEVSEFDLADLLRLGGLSPKTRSPSM